MAGRQRRPLVNSICGKRWRQGAHVIRVEAAKTTQINRGGTMAVELRESFVKIHSATRMQTLFF